MERRTALEGIEVLAAGGDVFVAETGRTTGGMRLQPFVDADAAPEFYTIKIKCGA
jgi:hypothetical protein